MNAATKLFLNLNFRACCLASKRRDNRQEAFDNGKGIGRLQENLHRRFDSHVFFFLARFRQLLFSFRRVGESPLPDPLLFI